MRAIALLLISACHVTTTLDSTRPGASRRVPQPEQAAPGRATIALSAAGALRFVEPLECPSEQVTEQLAATEVATRPNLATFIVGVIVTSAGAIATANGALGGGGASVGLGVGGLVVGLPLLVGPWLGLHRETRRGPVLPPLRTPGPIEACGDRPLRARAATLTVHGIEIYVAIADDGTFAVSPFQVIDVFELAQLGAWDVTASVVGDGPPRTVTAVIEAGAFARAAGAFLARADFDAAVAPLRVVPTVQSGPPRVSLIATEAGPAVRVVLGVHNAGPGAVYALRGQLSSSLPALDGRVIYVGHLERDQGAARELLIPLSPATAAALRGATVDVAVELRDAHGTAPVTPFRYRGPLQDDVRP